ncbi:MAG: ketoacyl-ACP synthase III [Sedimentisphaerales bacterium]|nr:ketoacyl-ACP synthase III [Sedimentisphaerales bacterium]
MTNTTKDGKFQATRRAVIRATGSAVPANILDNAALERMVDTTDEWITTRTGIKQRRIISEGESTATLALQAARQALDRADLTGADLDTIICATISPEMVFPSTACFVQNGLGNHHCCAFDLAAACSGYTYGIATASAMIQTGQIRTALVLGAETLSTLTDYTDRASCILFGDGAGAVLLAAEDNSTRGVLYSSLHADGSGWDTLCCQAYGSRHPAGKPLDDPSKIYMWIRGRETYQLAVRRIVEMVEETYQQCGIGNDDIALIVPHQMNARIIESVVKRLNLPPEKMFVNIDKYGNTSAASIALALDEALTGNHLQAGDLIILVAFGAGLTWAVNLIRL